MGNVRCIVQVAPRNLTGVVIAVRPGQTNNVMQILGDIDEQGRFYTYIHPAGKPIQFFNLFGPDVSLPPEECDNVIIQSGGKMWCGYGAFVDRVETLAPHLEDAHFFIGDEQYYIDELRIMDGELHYQCVHEGCWLHIYDFLKKRGYLGVIDPYPFDAENFIDDDPFKEQASE